jgi:type IV pilus assembly protein PilC
MPWYDFEAMNQTGQVFKDSVEAATQDEAETIIRQQNLFITKLTPKKQTTAAAVKGKKKKTLALGGASPSSRTPACLCSAA